MKHFEAKQCKEAIPLFEGSHQINPSVGALLYTGDCYQQLGQFASAYGAFREAARLASKIADKREKIASEKVAEVEGKLSYLTIEVPADRRVEGLVVKQDGKEVPSAVWGASIPIDEGAHKLEFSAPGHEPLAIEIKISGAGSRNTERAPALKPIKAAAPAPTPVPAPAPAAQPEPTREPRHEGAGKSPGASSSQRTAGFAVGGVGVGAMLVGGVLAWRAATEASDAKSRGDTPAFNDQKTPYTVGLVVGGVGVAALITGTVLVLSSPSSSSGTALRVAPIIGHREGGLWLSGRW